MQFDGLDAKEKREFLWKNATEHSTDYSNNFGFVFEEDAEGLYFSDYGNFHFTDGSFIRYFGSDEYTKGDGDNVLSLINVAAIYESSRLSTRRSFSEYWAIGEKENRQEEYIQIETINEWEQGTAKAKLIELSNNNKKDSDWQNNFMCDTHGAHPQSVCWDNFTQAAIKE